MKTAPTIYQRAADLGLRLEPAGDKLAVIPANRCPPEFAEELRAHKGELLAWLNAPPCPGWRAVPPADLPLNPLLPRPTPDNRERVIRHLLSQGCTKPGPLTAWLVRRESTYYDGPGHRWDCCMHAYAAARDAACWQLKRSEAQVWQLLEGFAESAANPPKK